MTNILNPNKLWLVNQLFGWLLVFWRLWQRLLSCSKNCFSFSLNNLNFSPDCPPQFLDFRSRRLRNGFGYCFGVGWMITMVSLSKATNYKKLLAELLSRRRSKYHQFYLMTADIYVKFGKKMVGNFTVCGVLVFWP